MRFLVVSKTRDIISSLVHPMGVFNGECLVWVSTSWTVAAGIGNAASFLGKDW